MIVRGSGLLFWATL